MKVIKIFFADLIFVFLNYFVTYIPFWTIRKFIFRMFGLSIGKKSRINMGSKLWQPWRITIGKNTIINEKCLLDGRGTLEIGDYVSISWGTIIYTASHISSSNDFEGFKKKVILKNGCWIGVNSVILPGVSIAKNTIIAANSLVNKSVSDENKIYGGSPAKFIDERKNSEDIKFKNTTFFR